MLIFLPFYDTPLFIMKSICKKILTKLLPMKYSSSSHFRIERLKYYILLISNYYHYDKDYFCY